MSSHRELGHLPKRYRASREALDRSSLVSIDLWWQPGSSKEVVDRVVPLFLLNGGRDSAHSFDRLAPAAGVFVTEPTNVWNLHRCPAGSATAEFLS